MSPSTRQNTDTLSVDLRSGKQLIWIGVRAGVVGWMLASAVLSWAVACATSSASLDDIRAQLSLSCAALAVSVAVAIAARKVHFGSALLGVAVNANSPNQSSRWQFRQLSRWASSLVAINAIAVSASACACALGTDWNRFGSDTDHNVVLDVVARASSEAVLLCAIGVLAARVPKHWVTHLALALSVASLWRGHLLYPVASSANPITTVFDETSRVGVVDEAGRAAWWGSPSIACVLLAAGVLAAWLATTARPSSRVTPRP